MEKITKILKSSDSVIRQLAYPPNQYQGMQTASVAKKTLLAELYEIELRINKLGSSTLNDLILLILKKLRVSINEIDLELDYEECLLNLILQEYFINTRELLKDQLVEIE